MSAILKIVEKACDAGEKGATISSLVRASGLDYNDALFVIRAMIADGSLRRMKGGRIVNRLPLKKKRGALRQYN